eukprot:8904468-Pyramimonas_sp.AAC.1
MGPRNGKLGGGDASEAFGGIPYGATERCTGLGRRMRTPPLGPSAGLPMGLRSAVLSRGNACEHRHWGS